MKNIKYISIAMLITFLIGGTACEDQLVEEPISQYAAETFFQTTVQANMSVLGIYSVLGDKNTYGKQMSMIFSADTDIQQMRGSNLSGDKRLICHYNASPNLAWIEATWLELWKGIERANVTITAIPEMDLYMNGSEEEKQVLNSYLGEAKFLRGLLYFDLMRNWGAVPVKTTPTKAGDDLFLTRASVQEVYNQIDLDMTEAAALVPWQSEKGTMNERISKAGVLGIHARVCLARGGYYLDVDGTTKRISNYKECYQKALDLTKQVIDSGEHGLNANYEKVFRNYCENVVDTYESIFEVGLFNPEGDSDNTGIVGSYNSPKCHPDSPYGRANSFMNTTPVFFAKYAEEDLRRDVAIATYEVLADGSQKERTGKKEWEWAPGKWRRDWHTAAPKNPNNTDINWVLLRYADVLLMHAEAQNEINEGPNAAAYESINLIRQRAGLADIDAGLSKDDFFNVLKDERAFELCFEGWRKLDLYRWGIMGETLRAHEEACKESYSKAPIVMGTYFDDNKDELLPIPQREMDENANMIQNAGY